MSVRHPDPKQSDRNLTRKEQDYNAKRLSLNECAVCFGLYEEDIDETIGSIHRPVARGGSGVRSNPPFDRFRFAIYMHANCDVDATYIYARTAFIR